MRKFIPILTIVFLTLLLNSITFAGGGSPGGLAANFAELKLTIHDETIRADENLNTLEPGLYEFVVTNKTSEKVVFLVQDLKTERNLGKIKIKPNKVKKYKVKLTTNGFRIKGSGEWQEYSIN